MRRPVTLACVAALVALSQSAYAQPAPDDEARQHFTRGVALTDDGDFGGAMVEFSRAYELTRNPALLFNLGVVQEGLHHWAEALSTLHRFVAEAPPAAVLRRRAELDASLARLRERVGTLTVTAEVPGLVVEVDGINRAMEHVREGLPLDVGRHRVRLSAPGRVTREDDIDVTGGARAVIGEALERTHSTVAVTCNVPGAEVLLDGRAVTTTPVDSPLEVSEGEHRVEVRRRGYTAFATVVEARGIGAVVRAELAWATPVPEDQGARVVLYLNESGGAAFLDERRFSFDGTERVPAGPHRLRVTRRDFLPWEGDVDLPAGTVVTRRLTLHPTSLYREEYLSNARSERRVALGILGGGIAATIGFVVATAAFASGLANNEDQQLAVQQQLNRCRLGPAPCDTQSLLAESDALPRDADQYRVLLGVGIGGIAIGIAGVVTGVVLLRRVPSLHRFSPTVMWSPVLAPGRAGFTLRF